MKFYITWVVCFGAVVLCVINYNYPKSKPILSSPKTNELFITIPVTVLKIIPGGRIVEQKLGYSSLVTKDDRIQAQTEKGEIIEGKEFLAYGVKPGDRAEAVVWIDKTTEKVEEVSFITRQK